MIWHNIFYNLPPKTLAICRCVCKTWNYIIVSEMVSLPSHTTGHLPSFSQNEDEDGSFFFSYSIWCRIFSNLSPETLAICRCICKTWNHVIVSLPSHTADHLPSFSQTQDDDNSFLLSYKSTNMLNTKDDSEVEAYIQRLREKMPPKVVEGEAHKQFENRLRLVGLEPGERYVDGTSLLEIFSVRVYPIAGNSCKIYGKILAKDELGNIMSLYDRSEEEAELVNNYGDLFLDMSICRAKPLTISVNFNDKIHCVNIAKGEFSLFYSTKEDFDEELWHEEVYGDCGYASISYRSFRSATIAEISVVLINRSADLDVCKTAMYGTICTRLGVLYRKYGHFNDKTDDHILVHKKQDVALNLSNEGIIELSKSMVVVPACSSLRVAIRLNACEDTSLIADGILEFYAKDDEHVSRDLLGKNGKCVLTVDVKWSLGDHIFPRMKVMDKEFMGKHDIGIVEIFSFSIGCSSENIRLYGKIQVCSNIDNFNIFEGDGKFANKACVSLPKKTVLVVDTFRIKLNLVDSEGREICKGFVLPSGFASRRICSVVRGEHGCAAIHYAIIKGGMAATVIVKFFPDDSSHNLNVFGSICTRYGDSEYKTYYDRAYYQSVLFKRSVVNPVTLAYGSEMPFVKYVVATPKNCSLVVKFDLKAWNPESPIPELFLQNKATFGAFKHDSQIIVGKGFYVIAEVSWESKIQNVSQID